MNNWKFLHEILPYPTGEDDNDVDLIDLDTVLNTGVGNDYKPINQQQQQGETEEQKAARIAAEEATKKQQQQQQQEQELDSITLLRDLNSDTLSEDQKALKQEILAKFKGTSIDNNGNILDKDGKVLADLKAVDTFLNAEPLLDEQGNEVDESGKIVRTKAQLEFENSTIGGVIASLPYNLVDDKGNSIVYEDTVEGYTRLAKDIGQIEAEERFENLLNSNPTLREVAKHLLSGGNLESFNNPIDYSKIDIKKLSDTEKIDLITKSFLANGIDKDRTNSLVELIKKGGEIDKETANAIKVLEADRVRNQQARDKAYQDSVKAENDRVIQYWTGVKQTIDSGKLGTLNIPKEDQEAFFTYLSKPINENGDSQEMLDNEKEGLSADLMMRYYRFKKYNLESIVKSEVNKDKITTLRDRITKAHKSRSSSASSQSSSNRNDSNPGDISLDELLQ